MIRFLLILILSFTVFSQEEDEPTINLYTTINHMMYDYNGECNNLITEKDICVKTLNISFSNIWTQYSAENIKDLLNQKIKSSPDDFNQKLEAKVVDGEVHLYAKEEIQKEEWLGTFNLKESLTVSQVNFNLFSDDFKALKKHKNGLPTLLIPEKDLSFEKFFNLMINLLLHLKNFEHSKLKTEILLLPKNLQELELFKFTPYEIENLLKGDELQTQLLNIIQYFKIGFPLFKETILNSWPPELIQDLFHQDEFVFEDFVYCLTMYLTRFNEESLPGIFHSALGKVMNSISNPFPPFKLGYTNKTQLDFDLLEQKEILNYKQFKAISQKKFEKGERIFIDYGRGTSGNYFLTGMYNGEEDTFEEECMQFVTFNKEAAKKYNEPGNSFVLFSLIL